MSHALAEPSSAREMTRPPRAAIGLLGLAFCGAVAWHGADRNPADPIRPLAIRGEVVASADPTFRVGSFNIHGGKGRRDVVDLDATAQVLRSADIDLAGLYEVRGGFRGDQAGDLGTRLSMASVFAGSERRWWHDHFGNGLLTRRSIGEVIRIPLPGTQGKRFRNTVLTSFNAGKTPVRLLAAHIDTEVDRERQLAVVFDLFRSLNDPAILIGDLNCTASHPPLAALLAEPGVVDAVAAKLGPTSQHHRIDHMIVRGLIVNDAGVVESGASDHPLVWAELSAAQPTSP